MELLKEIRYLFTRKKRYDLQKPPEIMPSGKDRAAAKLGHPIDAIDSAGDLQKVAQAGSKCQGQS